MIANPQKNLISVYGPDPALYYGGSSLVSSCTDRAMECKIDNKCECWYHQWPEMYLVSHLRLTRENVSILIIFSDDSKSQSAFITYTCTKNSSVMSGLFESLK